jgi:ribosomal protein S5
MGRGDRVDFLGVLMGPTGGLFATGFGMGAAGGYAFATRTAIAEARKRIVALEKERNDLRDKVMDLLEGGRRQ